MKLTVTLHSSTTFRRGDGVEEAGAPMEMYDDDVQMGDGDDDPHRDSSPGSSTGGNASFG